MSALLLSACGEEEANQKRKNQWFLKLKKKRKRKNQQQSQLSNTNQNLLKLLTMLKVIQIQPLERWK